MKRIWIICALLVLSSAVLAGCGSNPDQDAEFEDVTWVLESYGRSNGLTQVIEGTTVSATFNSEDGQVTGTAGCNHYFGSYELDGGLSIPMLGSTEMYCMDPEGVMDQETAYLQLMSKAEDYEVDGGTLTIHCGDEVLIFTEE